MHNTQESLYLSGLQLAVLSALAAWFITGPQSAHAQSAQAQAEPAQAEPRQLEPVVVSASRSAQRRFDAPAAIDAVEVDPFRSTSPLVNLSELLSAVPGLQLRQRENYAQDLQLSVRGFGTRSTFGVRGVRILIDGIPATMPDGQGQASSASLNSASRIEVLRGPAAQLYGNAAGGVVQVFTRDPPVTPAAAYAGVTLGAGADGQRQLGLSAGGGSQTLGGLIDVTRYETDGYRDHSAARRTQLNAKVVARPASDTTVTGVLNLFDQPLAQDPLGLTHAAFAQNPRQSIAAASLFDTRKTVTQQQAGLVVEHRLTQSDSLHARLYGGTRQVFQTLAFSGAAVTSSGGVVDLDRGYGGIGLQWRHDTQWNGLPLRWVAGVEADTLREKRRGFVNNNGVAGALRRDEDDSARNLDLFAQLSWNLSAHWQAQAGLRTSRVRFAVDDHFRTAASPDDSGSVQYRHTSPVAGLVWHAGESLNFYANLGGGFETPTLAESAYRSGASGPNFSLRPARSRQGEIGVKARSLRHQFDMALFDARSDGEIVPLTVENGRTIFQNVDQVQRRGLEASLHSDWGRIATRLAYTWLDARFNTSFVNGSNALVAAGKRLPGVPQHSLFADIAYRPIQPLTLGLEMRAEGKAYVDDANSDAAPGYATVNIRAGYALGMAATNLYVYGRIDNLLDKKYAGSLIVNDGNGRFFEPAAGRRFFAGVRAMF